MSIQAFLSSLLGLLLLAGCHPAESGPRTIEFAGSVERGEPFRHAFDRFEFLLEPTEHGWWMDVREKGRDESLARLTPPLHFVPNPREIEGWHFRNPTNTAPNGGKVNAPQESREFIFSPEVGRTIQGPERKMSVTREDIQRVRSFGRGLFRMTSIELSPPIAGERARIEKMSFSCSIQFVRLAE
jgi:hypothetical protein